MTSTPFGLNTTPTAGGESHRRGPLAPAAATISGPVVAVLCPMAWGVRNFVYSGVIRRLLERGMRPRLLLPRALATPVLAAGLGPQSVLPLLQAEQRPCRGAAMQYALLAASFARRHRLVTRRIMHPWAVTQRRGSRLRELCIELGATTGAHDPVFEWQRKWFERRVAASLDLRQIARQLRELAPALLVSTTCVAGEEEPYLIAAERLGIPRLACVLSFDNLSSRGIIRRFEHYAVWNERMAQQVLALYPDRRAEQLTITGAPQFDVHADVSRHWSRAETLARLGLGPGDRYLVYGANCAQFTPSEPELVAALAGRCDEIPELAKHRIIARPHPLDRQERWTGLAGHPRVRVDPAWAGAGATIAPDDQLRLASLLAHADVCLNSASTMSLDAAAVGTPVVCIAFAHEPGSAEDRFVRAVHWTDHYRPISESGGVRLAGSLDDAMDALVAYVREPGRDAAARQRLVASECGPVDGRSAERVADLIACLAAGAQATRDA